MSNKIINQWEIWHVNEVVEEVVGMPTQKSLIEKRERMGFDPSSNPFQKQKRPYKVIIVSNDAVNHNLETSTAILLFKPKTNERLTLSPTEFLLPNSLDAIELRNRIVMVHMIHTVKHTQLKKKFGQLDDEKLREQIRQVMREYFGI